ncbi:MAG TPA: hypothetical protein VHI93_05675 [Candidatus Thermoplasmatota archaeon]|nr:hypothetical protein [Candidatus Thermoplasmatota archaeon]
MPGDRSPFRAKEMGEEELQRAYHNAHDLREMYTRENTERRRFGGHTLRRYLTSAQDNALTAKMVKIRAEHAVANNDDVVLVFAQALIAEGREGELDPKLAEAAKNAVVPRRGT